MKPGFIGLGTMGMGWALNLRKADHDLAASYWGFGFDLRSDPIGYQALAAAWNSYVETAIEVFGADRCMMQFAP